MQVIIGVDPHKASHTAVAIGDARGRARPSKVRASRRQVDQLLAWAEPFPQRTWAIEWRGGLGYLLAQQLVAGRRARRRRAGHARRAGPGCWASGRVDKNDPQRRPVGRGHRAARARTARGAPRSVTREVLRLLAKRNTDIGNQRTRVVCRLHALLIELAPGGIAKEINASDVDAFLAERRPDNTGRTAPLRPGGRASRRHPPSSTTSSRHRIKRIRDAVARRRHDRRPTSSGRADHRRAWLIGYSGDIARFANRDRYAAYNGTAPVEFSSGGRTVHRLSQRGNRQLNHALHMAAICQLRQPHSEGRAYFDRKVAEGKTKKEALRALKRQSATPSTATSSLDATTEAERAREDKRERLEASAAGSHP